MSETPVTSTSEPELPSQEEVQSYHNILIPLATLLLGLMVGGFAGSLNRQEIDTTALVYVDDLFQWRLDTQAEVRQYLADHDNAIANRAAATHRFAEDSVGISEASLQDQIDSIHTDLWNMWYAYQELNTDTNIMWGGLVEAGFDLPTTDD